MATNSIAISKDVQAISSWQGVVVVLGRFFLRADFPVCCPKSLYQANHRLFGFSRRALGFDRGSAFRCGGYRRRP
jgi:hypothetical protein